MLQILRQKLQRPWVLMLWLCASSVAALAGPFKTYESQTLPQNLIYWGLVCGLAMLLSQMFRAAAEQYMPEARIVRRQIAVSLSFTLIFTTLLFTFNEIWFGAAPRVDLSFATLLALVGLISGVVSVTTVTYQTRAQDAQVSASRSAAAAPEVPLLGRLPEALRGNILCISAEDHHVHILTDQGRATLFTRFGDAMAMLGTLDGLRVHRSHWVARAAVAGQRRTNGRLFLVLGCGTEIPVSRKRRPDVEAAFADLNRLAVAPA